MECALPTPGLLPLDCRTGREYISVVSSHQCKASSATARENYPRSADWSIAVAVKKQRSLSQNREMFGHLCGLDKFMVLSVIWSIMVTDWLCLMGVFCDLDHRGQL